MLTLAQALDKRDASGVPLPTAYESLRSRGVDICKGQLALFVGPASAGKSLLAFNMIARMGDIGVLAFLLDTTELTAGSRFASILTGEPYKQVKQNILDKDQSYRDQLAKSLANVKVEFFATSLQDVQRGIDAYEQRYGLPPDLVLIDNIGNLSALYENEHQIAKTMSLELNLMAMKEQCAIIAAAHTTDEESDNPAKRSKTLGKISQFPRVMLSVQYVESTGEYKIAVVKNSEGKTDAKAEHPLVLYADPDRMLVSEHPVGREGLSLTAVRETSPPPRRAHVDPDSGEVLSSWGGY